MSIWTSKYWKAQVERAVSAGAISLLSVSAVGDGLDLFDLNWKPLVSAFVIGVALSIVKGVATNQISGDGPGIGSAETLSE